MSEIYTKPVSFHLSNSKIRNLLGLTFNHLFVVQFLRTDKYGKAYWLCVCKCGNVTEKQSYNLLIGKVKSCGCQKLELISKANSRHGECNQGMRSPEFRAYVDAKKRCGNTNAAPNPDYAGRGIEFRFESFEEFLAEVGRKPTAQHSIERKDVNGHYEKGNVCWATPSEQARNKRNSFVVTYNGISKNVRDWSDITGVASDTIKARIKLGWCVDCALHTTARKRNACKHKIE
ncbi:MAG TPA: hypothetical protein VIL74_09075 [Pyrinomonadaceae bacterium]|jgi:hypothetical protein